jgi:hypothetical protein
MNKLRDNIKRILRLMEVESSNEVNEEGETTSTETDTTTDTKSSGGYPTVKKHSDTYQTTRGKGNMLGKSGEKWESGVVRGKGNKIDNSKWESGRAMGSTGP